MAAPSVVKELVDRFNAHKETYHSGQYSEAQLREEFINPLFKALGWDMFNEKGWSDAYKEVIHEDAIKIGGRTKAPDYCFRAGGGMRSFFVEAKKPSIDISEAISPAYQLRRYAWSAKLPISILTDFEEFAVYDCRIRPDKNDKAATARIIYLNYTAYIDRWDELYGLFSPDAIRKGSLERFVSSKKVKKGTAEVDKAFLIEIESWRDELARNLALRNEDLSPRDLNFAVQRTIDRIIFLRICEDRGIEPYATLEGLQNAPNIYRRMRELFQRADDRYNSGLFHFTPEKDRAEPPDELTLTLTIDDKPLKEILRNLYFPDSPYEFSVFPAEILGQVYEQFLGKVIRLTKGHQAKVEEKPEVRKAGGVYYTPAYIVDYIVRHTIGKLLNGASDEPFSRDPKGSGLRNEGRGKMTPTQAAKLRILDPACGSGSFLLGAYQYLLDWHRDRYIEDDPEKHARGRNPKLYRGRSGDWRLTSAERKRILLNNIYGVDIDQQAVEVTKLSLLLKVLEGESAETISNQLRLFHQRALPDLGRNIKCGNSLIGPDFYQGRQKNFFDDEEQYRINAFDWKAEFPEIFKSGGFDAVIGNPPYGFHQIHSENEKVYFKQHYLVSQGSFEHYFLFYERALKLLCKNGINGFIVPVTWLTIPSALSLRKLILDKYWLSEISWLPELVFSNAQVNTLVSFIRNSLGKKVTIRIYDTLGFISPPNEERHYDQSAFIADNYYIGIFEKKDDTQILEKIISVSCPLKEIAHPCSGYNPYEVGSGQGPDGRPQTKNTILEKPYHAQKKLGPEWKREIVGRDLNRYIVNISNKRWVKYGPWLSAPRDPNNFVGRRLLVQEITGGKDRRIVAAYYDRELYHSRDVIPIKINRERPHPFYLLGIINSYLITWYHHKRNPKAQKGLFPKILVSDLNNLPIRSIDFSNKSDKRRHDRMVELVEAMLELHKKLAGVGRFSKPSKKDVGRFTKPSYTGHEKTLIERQIDATDHEIDQLVYELYGLSDQEIAIVEDKM